MAHSQLATTLDLHGRRMEEAISEVTLFLERIRRTVSTHSKMGGHNTFFVKIITGAGSHSSHGPILRSAVQKLLEKRGMVFKLERGGGAFQVDALSGVDLYDPAPAKDTKVLVTEQDEFHQLAASLRRRNNTRNFSSAAGMAQCTAGSRPTRTAPTGNSSDPYRRSSSLPEPLPAQVASEQKELQSAVKASVTENQRRRNRHERETKEYEREFQKAISESNLLSKKNKAEAEEKEKDSLKLAYEQSLADEQQRQHLTEKQYEEELMRALEQSTQESSNQQKFAEDELIQQALAESMALAEAEKANNAVDEDDLLKRVIEQSLVEEKDHTASFHRNHESYATNRIEHSTREDHKLYATEDDLVQEALAESMAFAEAEKASKSEDDFLEKAISESLQGGANDNAANHQNEEESPPMSTGIDILGEVKRLSLKQQQEEEEAMKEAIQVCKNVHLGEVD